MSECISRWRLIVNNQKTVYKEGGSVSVPSSPVNGGCDGLKDGTLFGSLYIIPI